jgi:uncharacterized repeat protein (TIGR01451 family)
MQSDGRPAVRRTILTARFVLPLLLALTAAAQAAPISPAGRGLLERGRSLFVIVEFDAAGADSAADAERTRRGLSRDDAAVLTLRSRGYAAIKDQLELAAGGGDARSVLDYSHFPLAVWRVGTPAALHRLETDPRVHMVHENLLLHPVSVSDLGFINQPQTAAQGASGAGTTIAVIDGGLGGNYALYPDFGACILGSIPAPGCRVVMNQEFYPGASTQSVHGTNVSAIALGVAPGANLAMFDIFDGDNASSADVLTAMNTAISNQGIYNIVAINMSLGDSSSNAGQCTTSALKSAVSSASKAGITTVVAAGNSGSKTGLSNPACTPGVVSVGAVYDAAYGTVQWGVGCSDTSAADTVTCFSQSASYLSLLAPGTFVNAPDASFQESGTSQATPHVSGAVAVLRARYPAESLGQTLQRMQLSDIRDTDASSGITTPRLDLLAAVKQGTALSVAGSGPTQASAGGTGTYSLTVTNGGPLAATDVILTDILPAGAVLVSSANGCAIAGNTVTCAVGALASGAHSTINIKVQWTVSGAVYDTASVRADQLNAAPANQQALSFGMEPQNASDGPVPPWVYAVLAVFMWVGAWTRLVPPGMRLRS